MKTRVVIAYGPWSVGHVFPDMPGNVARTLIARGLVEEIAAEPPAGTKPATTRRAPRQQEKAAAR